MEIPQLEEQQNWIKLQLLMTQVEGQLRVIFKNQWKSIYLENWTEGSKQDQVCKLIAILDHQHQSPYKTMGKMQKKSLQSGQTSQWDLSTLSKILQKVKSSSTENDFQNKNIQSAVEVRNILAHHPDKIINDQDFQKIWAKLVPASLSLGLSQYEVSEIEFKFSSDSSGAVKEYLKLKNDANDLYNVGDFEGAIKLYSKALILPNLSNDNMGILYSNRCISYLKLNSTEEKANLALSDARNCEKYRPNWFKSHWRIAQSQMALRNLSEALISYNKALGLEPNHDEIREGRDACQIELVDESIKVDLDPYSHLDSRKFSKYMKDRINLPQNDVETSKMINEFEEMAIRKGDAYSYVLQGHQYRDGIKVEQNYETAAKFYTKAALEGHPEGLYCLALLKINGKGCIKDMTEGIGMLERAANDKKTPKMPNGALAVGIHESQFALGRLCHYGVGMPISIETAVRWYTKAAENGSSGAANNLGCMYNSGSEIPTNEKLAVQYWEMACTSSILPAPRAMENLANYYLAKGDSKMAEMYWKMTKEHGNFFPQLLTENQFQEKLELLKMAEIEYSSKASSSSLNEQQEGNDFPISKSELFGFADKLNRMTVLKGPYNLIKGFKPDEIIKSANNGSKYASKLVKTMVHNYTFLDLIENNDLNGISESVWTKITLEYGYAAAGEEYIIQRPSNQQFTGVFLRILRNILIKNETCELDMCARLSYVYLNMSSFVEMTAFLPEAIKKYPQCIRFYDMKVAMFTFLRDYKSGLKECEKYLLLFPGNPDLLYFKAFFVQNLPEGNKIQYMSAIKAWEEWIKCSEPDHRKIPKAYYCIALMYYTAGQENETGQNRLNRKAQEFYRKGLNAEKLQLSMFLPYESNEKECLSMIFKFNQKQRPNSNLTGHKVEPKSDPSKKDFGYLSNPKRIMLIKMHRDFIKEIKVLNYIPLSSYEPSKIQKIPKSLAGLEEIHLVHMDPTKDKVYDGTLVNLTVIDDPNPYSTSIHLVVQDDLQDVQRLCVYNFDRSQRIDDFFGFGAKFTVLNPYMRMASDGRPMLRVDDPESIMFNPANRDIKSLKLCHYCGSENSASSCSTCKTNYCSRQCQMNDWKILKHKLVCM